MKTTALMDTDISGEYGVSIFKVEVNEGEKSVGLYVPAVRNVVV